MSHKAVSKKYKTKYLKIRLRFLILNEILSKLLKL